MADTYELYPMGNCAGGLGKKFGDEGVSIARKSGSNAVIVSFMKVGPTENLPQGGRAGQITSTNYEFTAEEWREVERTLQIAK